MQYIYTYCSQYSALHINLLLTIQCSIYKLTAHNTVQYIYTYFSQYSAVNTHLLFTVQCNKYTLTADNAVQYIQTYCSKYSAVHIHLLLTIQCSMYTLTAHNTATQTAALCGHNSDPNKLKPSVNRNITVFTDNQSYVFDKIFCFIFSTHDLSTLLTSNIYSRPITSNLFQTAVTIPFNLTISHHTHTIYRTQHLISFCIY